MFNVVAKAGIIGDLKDASKVVKAIADNDEDINGLIEDAL